MSSLAFFYPVIRALSQGKILRQIAAWLLRSNALFAIVTGFIFIILMLKHGITSDTPATETVALVILAIIILAGTLAVTQVFWFRAQSVLDIEESPFTVIPIISQMLRCSGEVYATVFCCIGFGGCIYLWIAGFPFHEFPVYFPGNHPDSSFLFGLGFLVEMLLIGVCALIIFYFLAEAVVVLVDIAMTLRKGLAVGGFKADIATSGKSFSCPKCHSEQMPGSAFCDVCGERLS